MTTLPRARALTARRYELGSLTLLLLLLLLAHAALLPVLPQFWRGLAAHVILMLPGALLALLLFRYEAPLVRAFLALAGALALPPLVLLALHALPGAIPWWAPVLAANAISLVIGVAAVRDACTNQPQDAQLALPPERYEFLALALILALGALLRFTALGGAEFQGDEGRAILMAANALHGVDDMLLLHKKGPVEVLLPLGPLAVTGQLDETIARLPFALAGLGTMLGVYLLGRAMFGASGAAVGLLAALILALDGFLIGFARIVQYQSVLVLLLTAALLLAWRFFAGAPFPRRSLLCIAALLAVALLAHYDAIWSVPALLWLVLAGSWKRRWSAREWLTHLVPAVLLGSVLLASFFVPFALNERFGRTLRYLGERAGQDDAALALYNNLPYYADVSTFYNTTFAMVALGSALAAGLAAWLGLYVRPRLFGIALVVSLVAGILLTALVPDRLQVAAQLNLAALLFGVPLAALAIAPRTPPALRTLVLWFAAGFVAKAFLVARPNTHFYVMHAPAALLVALSVVCLWGWGLGRALPCPALPWLRAGVVAVGTALLLLATPYAYILFVRQEPEYRRTFPEHRPPIFRAGFGDEVPRFANFGFPHRAGYKVVGELFAQGVLRGSYASNEEELITGWYLRGAFRCMENADYVLLATHPLDRVRLSERDVREDYHLLGIVTTSGVGKLEIWSRAPLAAEPRAFALEELEQAFDARSVTNFPTQRSLAEVVPQHRLDMRWPDDIQLVGYDLDPTLQPGAASFLTLYWRTPLEPPSGGNGFEPLVELVDEAGRAVAQAEPYCTPPNSEWYWQWLSGVNYRLTPTADLPPGRYTLRVALHNPQTGARLPFDDATRERVVGTMRVAEQPIP
jgi:4-amino-4-deoxy-L-arabinose transferase-like glycosyltransferase